MAIKYLLVLYSHCKRAQKLNLLYGFCDGPRTMQFVKELKN